MVNYGDDAVGNGNGFGDGNGNVYFDEWLSFAYENYQVYFDGQ